MNTSNKVTPSHKDKIQFITGGIAYIPGRMLETNPQLVEDYYQNQYINFNQNESGFLEVLKEFIVVWRGQYHYSYNTCRVLARQHFFSGSIIGREKRTY